MNVMVLRTIDTNRLTNNGDQHFQTIHVSDVKMSDANHSFQCRRGLILYLIYIFYISDLKTIDTNRPTGNRDHHLYQFCTIYTSIVSILLFAIRLYTKHVKKICSNLIKF